ncbi:MAG: heme o synthase [Gammaproteobacteria bacterium]|jgi:protoheme IX farnesyltransferase|nr:heme o synthase [Gammaproteobacteria bacterium]
MAIAPDDSLITALSCLRWREYLALTKPKVSLLIVFTAIVGMVLASPGLIPLPALVFGTLGIAMASGSAATLNHILDRRIDKQMARTRRRPLATGSLRTSQALAFAGVLGVGSTMVLWLSVGSLCALLTLGSLIGYAVIYTGWLKHATPQNIVIGGAAGAAPPVLGWVAVTHSIDAQALVLFLIIFMWTPPHFWSLAIARREEYAKVGIPMLPVTHGIPYTRRQILLYTVLLILCTLIPAVIGMSGLIYLAAALALDVRFLYLALALQRGVRPDLPIRTFRFSITYLMALFGAFIADHYCRLLF